MQPSRQSNFRTFSSPPLKQSHAYPRVCSSLRLGRVLLPSTGPRVAHTFSDVCLWTCSAPGFFSQDHGGSCHHSTAPHAPHYAAVCTGAAPTPREGRSQLHGLCVLCAFGEVPFAPSAARGGCVFVKLDEGPSSALLCYFNGVTDVTARRCTRPCQGCTHAGGSQRPQSGVTPEGGPAPISGRSVPAHGGRPTSGSVK